MNNRHDGSGHQPGDGRSGAADRDGWGVAPYDPGGGRNSATAPKKKTGFIITAIVVVVAVAIASGAAWWALGGAEKRDRSAVAAAANEFISTVRDGERLSELNALICEQYRGAEDVILLGDREMAANGYSLAEVMGEDRDDLIGLEVSGDDVEFLSEQRSAAIVVRDWEHSGRMELMYRKIDGDWMFCDPTKTLSDLSAEDID